MPECDRLRRLQMGKAGEDCRGVFVSAADQRPLKRLQSSFRPIQRIAHP